MLKLIDQILDQIPRDMLTDTELVALIPGSAAARYNQTKRALAKKELIQIRRGLYYLAKRYQRHGVNLYELAQGIYGPSYVSFESALSFHGLIPEAIYGVDSASAKRSRVFKTPFGVFTYTQIPPRVFPEGVERIERDGHVFLLATPLKALADYVYVRRLNWAGVAPLVESLRIEREQLKFQARELEILAGTYASARVSRFLKGLKKDLGL